MNDTMNIFALGGLRTLLQFAKKKRKRDDSGSDVDLDVTPPPSPKDDEPIEKRRSGRNTNKRKKYVDDVDYNFSDDENPLMHIPPEGRRQDAASASQKGSAVAAIAAASVGPTSTAEGDSSDLVPPGNDQVEASISTVPTLPGTPTEASLTETPGLSGPNYAFVVIKILLYSFLKGDIQHNRNNLFNVDFLLRFHWKSANK